MTGIHHTTGITGSAQANVDFYADLLGLRLVKRTVNHNDPDVLHLFYGDANGSPGSLLTFFVWQDTAPGRRGAGQATEIGLLVPRESIGEWMQRFLSRGVRFTGPTRQGDESRLTLADPDGLPLVLVGVPNAPEGSPWPGSPVPPAMQIRGIHHVLILSEKPDETGAALENLLGFRAIGSGEGERLYRTDAEIGHTIRVRDASGFWPAIGGVGTLHHVAFRAADAAEERGILAAVQLAGLKVSDVREHGYFQSIYFEEPGGSILEVATDSPGLTRDEPLESLGTRLVLPPDWEPQRREITAVLPPIALPGEERIMTRDLDWIHRYQPGTSGWTLLLLHGTGGNETSLLSLGQTIAPEAGQLSVRGRSLEEGFPRFFRRFTETSYDQAHLISEADALAQFVRDAAEVYGFDARKVVPVGFSNGANIALASLSRNPGVYAAAILLRPVMPFDAPPPAQLGGMPILVTHGTSDSYLPYAESVVPYLREQGATVREIRFPTGHQLINGDLTAAAEFLRERGE